MLRPERGFGDGDAYDPRSGRLKEIVCLQIEASYLCNVDCPYCVPMNRRKTLKRPPWFMPAERLDTVLRQLAEEKMPVRHCAFSGRGEPLLHPGLPGLVTAVKQWIGCPVSVHTNGNFTFDPALVDAGVDALSVAVDGTTQAVYAKYRKGGDLKKALRFMKAARACRDRKSAKMTLIWQYILFRWNTSEKQLARLFEIVKETGVDELLFVETDTPGGDLSAGPHGSRAELLSRIQALAGEHPGLIVDLMTYNTVYRDRPPVELNIRLRRGGRGASRSRPLLEGRLMNLGVEPQRLEVHVWLLGKKRNRDRLYAKDTTTLASREERIDGLRFESQDLEPGFDRLRVDLFLPTIREPALSRELPLP
jgi:MoaA/NifB/PqqE/SkfB family radical SAM enzyme